MTVMVAIVILIAFCVGAVAALVVIVAFASRREDRLKSLWDEAPGAASKGTRWLVGTCARRDSPPDDKGK